MKQVKFGLGFSLERMGGMAKNFTCWCILTTFGTGYVRVMVCWFSLFWCHFDLEKQVKCTVSRHIHDNVWEEWAEIHHVHLYLVISPEMKKANSSTWKLSSYRVGRGGNTPDCSVVKLSCCVSYELWWFGATFIRQNWDSLISLITHIVCLWAKTHPLGTPPLWGSDRYNGPLTRYAKLWVDPAPGMPGTFSLPPTSKETLFNDPSMHDGTSIMHVPSCKSGLLTRGGKQKCSRHSRHMRNPQFRVSGKKHMGLTSWTPKTMLYQHLTVSKLSKSVISQMCAICSCQSSEGQWGSWILKPYS